MPILSRCCSKMRSQQFGMSAACRYSGPPWNRPRGLISSPAVMLAASSDCGCALWMSDIVVVVIRSVGMDVMLFDIRLSSFYVVLSSFSLISSSDDVRCAA